MDEIYSPDGVRSRLILAALGELDKHGVLDFSLRRVAIEAGVSCAAPYRHFKDKDELIAATVDYVIDGWILLSSEILSVFRDDPAAALTELCVAGLRFFIANGNFRTVLMSARGTSHALSSFDKPITDAALAAASKGKGSDGEALAFKAITMLYGSIMLVDGGYESAEAAAESLRRTVESLL